MYIAFNLAPSIIQFKLYSYLSFFVFCFYNTQKFELISSQVTMITKHHKIMMIDFDKTAATLYIQDVIIITESDKATKKNQ